MYDILDVKKISELYLLRQSWISPKYELTDRVYSYGKITYRKSAMNKATVVTAVSVWTFQRGPFFSHSIVIKDQNDVAIGTVTREWFSRKTKLTLESGSSAEFFRPSIFSREHIWESEGYGKIMHIKSSPLSFEKIIYIDQSNAPASLIPLLIFLGSYLVISRRRRKTAMVSNLFAIFGGNFYSVPVANAGSYQ